MLNIYIYLNFRHEITNRYLDSRTSDFCVEDTVITDDETYQMCYFGADKNIILIDSNASFFEGETKLKSKTLKEVKSLWNDDREYLVFANTENTLDLLRYATKIYIVTKNSGIHNKEIELLLNNDFFLTYFESFYDGYKYFTYTRIDDDKDIFRRYYF